jgi:hypothetical protein
METSLPSLVRLKGGGGSCPCSSENTTMKALLTPKESPQKRKYKIWN